ncbi:MAG: hypothetical protein CMP36_02470 [Rickettsiales bacterium]|nr:hypothetical protein [Rickettsiales bacterium]OUV80533.1 MAG: riboflavin biosynthesis protein RibF [Rickettsiales bacterium TMED131]|tara:strand:- start:1333 stop:2286 length:954 start_codon:yes stop_codon:yes gene_type:complete
MLVNRNNFNDSKKYNYSIAIGNFDGIHKGHKYLLNNLKKLKKSKTDRIGVLSFTPHPVKLIAPDRWKKNLVRFRTKYEQLKNIGIDVLFLITFTNKFSKISAEEFINEYLIKKINVKNIIVGKDFRFGCNRKGNIELLKKYKKSFNLITVNKKEDLNNIIYSSSSIRDLIRNGNIREANEVLGYNWEVQGKVVKGKSLGRLLGFPTANIKYLYQIAPQKGIYACWVKIEGEKCWRMSAVSTGVRPHYNGTEEILEVYVFNYSGNLYQKRITVSFVRKIRGEEKFNNELDLINQMKKDCINIKDILEKNEINYKNESK